MTMWASKPKKPKSPKSKIESIPSESVDDTSIDLDFGEIDAEATDKLLDLKAIQNKVKDEAERFEALFKVLNSILTSQTVSKSTADHIKTQIEDYFKKLSKTQDSIIHLIKYQENKSKTEPKDIVELEKKLIPELNQTAKKVENIIPTFNMLLKRVGEVVYLENETDFIAFYSSSTIADLQMKTNKIKDYADKIQKACHPVLALELGKVSGDHKKGQEHDDTSYSP